MVIKYAVENQYFEEDGQILYFLEGGEARLLGQYYLSIHEQTPRRLFSGEPQLIAADPGKETKIEGVLALSGLNITGVRKVKRITDIYI